MYAKMKKENAFCIPQATSDLSDSLQADHEDNLIHCKCKVYIGTVNNVKGLTVPIVHYMPIVVTKTGEKIVKDSNTPSQKQKSPASTTRGSGQQQGNVQPQPMDTSPVQSTSTSPTVGQGTKRDLEAGGITEGKKQKTEQQNIEEISDRLAEGDLDEKPKEHMAGEKSKDESVGEKLKDKIEKEKATAKAESKVVRRTWSYYGAATRSSCEFHLTEVRLEESLATADKTDKWRNYMLGLITPVKASSAMEIKGSRYALSSFSYHSADQSTPLRGHTDTVACLSWHPSLDLLATGSWDSSGHIWNMAQPGVSVDLKHSDSVRCLDWSRTGRLATGSDNGVARIWSSTRHLELTLTKHTRRINGIKFSPNSATILTGSEDKSCIVWDTTSGAVLHQTFSGSSAISAVDWRDDTSFSSGCVDGSVQYWRLSAPVQTYRGHTSSVTCVRWSGQYLASASLDNTVMIWRPDTNTPVQTFSGHKDSVYDVKWSPATAHHNILASWDSSGEVRVWDVTTGDCLHTLTNVKDGMTVYRLDNHIDFSPDGRLLACRGERAVVYRTTDWTVVTQLTVAGIQVYSILFYYKYRLHVHVITVEQ